MLNFISANFTSILLAFFLFLFLLDYLHCVSLFCLLSLSPHPLLFPMYLFPIPSVFVSHFLFRVVSPSFLILPSALLRFSHIIFLFRVFSLFFFFFVFFVWFYLFLYIYLSFYSSFLVSVMFFLLKLNSLRLSCTWYASSYRFILDSWTTSLFIFCFLGQFISSLFLYSAHDLNSPNLFLCTCFSFLLTYF